MAVNSLATEFMAPLTLRISLKIMIPQMRKTISQEKLIFVSRQDQGRREAMIKDRSRRRQGQGVGHLDLEIKGKHKNDEKGEQVHDKSGEILCDQSGRKRSRRRVEWVLPL